SHPLIPMHFLWCRISTMATEAREAESTNISIFPSSNTYVDIKPGAYAVYTRYRDHWKKWPGPAIGLSEQLVHPHLHEAEQRARYINFAPDHGIEWIAKQTYVRRQQKLRQLGLLEDRHATSAQAGLELASTIVDKYLIKTLGGLGTRVEQLNNTPSRVVEVSSDSDSDVDVVSRPSKRARTAPNAPTDPEIQKLEQIFAVLQTDQNFRQLNTRKRELLRSLDAQCFSNISPQLLKTLEKHFFSSEAEQAIPKLKAEINQVEKYLRATEARRKAAEQRLAEYERKRNSMQSD
ncbi:hypothetical protein R3P38DRAFT_3057743, partial [Favolaschia claudopus]